MYFLVLAAHPKPDNPEYGATDGAFASCWIRAASADEAERIARGALEEARWDTEEVDQAPRAIRRHEYFGDPDTLDLFDQAEQDGVAITLHTWPVGAPEEELD